MAIPIYLHDPKFTNLNKKKKASMSELTFKQNRLSQYEDQIAHQTKQVTGLTARLDDFRVVTALAKTNSVYNRLDCEPVISRLKETISMEEDSQKYATRAIDLLNKSISQLTADINELETTIKNQPTKTPIEEQCIFINRKQLREALGEFDGISQIRLATRNNEKIDDHKVTNHFVIGLDICGLIMSAILPDDEEEYDEGRFSDCEDIVLPDITLKISMRCTTTYSGNASYDINMSATTREPDELVEGYGGRRMPHPHWIDPDDPCLGDYGEVIYDALHAFDFPLAVSMILMYLKAYDPLDSAGRHYPSFIRAEQDRATRAELIARIKRVELERAAQQQAAAENRTDGLDASVYAAPGFVDTAAPNTLDPIIIVDDPVIRIMPAELEQAPIHDPEERPMREPTLELPISGGAIMPAATMLSERIINIAEEEVEDAPPIPVRANAPF